MRIYVCAATRNILKIGITRDIKARLKGLQNGNPFRLRIIYSVDVSDADAHKAEKHIHKLLHRQRAHMNGEWFRCAPERAIQLVERVAAMFNKHRILAEASTDEAPAGTIVRNVYCQQCFHRGVVRSSIGEWPKCHCSRCGNAAPLIGGRDPIRPWWKARKEAQSS